MSCLALDVELEVVGLATDGHADAAEGDFRWGVDGFLAGDRLSVVGLDLKRGAVEGDGHYREESLPLYGADERFSFAQGVLGLLE